MSSLLSVSFFFILAEKMFPSLMKPYQMRRRMLLKLKGFNLKGTHNQTNLQNVVYTQEIHHPCMQPASLSRKESESDEEIMQKEKRKGSEHRIIILLKTRCEKSCSTLLAYEKP